MARQKKTKKEHRKSVKEYHAADMYHWHRRVAFSMQGNPEAVKWLEGVGIKPEESTPEEKQ